ncbi:MAG: hypothetical protein M1324_01780 [Patescibacteria group bacterium]|nr:hypothetical protein [Patescibacteria group bacterium]
MRKEQAAQLKELTESFEGKEVSLPSLMKELREGELTQKREILSRLSIPQDRIILVISGESWPDEELSDLFADRPGVTVLMAHTIRDAEEMFQKQKENIAIVFLDGDLESGSCEAQELVQVIIGDPDFTGQLVGTGLQLPSNSHRVCKKDEMANVAMELLPK